MSGSIVKIKLSAVERLTLLQILPAEGTIVTMRQVQDLRKRISFTEGELEALKFHEEDKLLKWDPEADVIKGFEFRPLSLKLIVDQLQELEKNKRISLQHLTLWEKFIEPQPAEAEEAEAKEEKKE